MNTKDKRSIRKNPTDVSLPTLTREALFRWEIEQFKHEAETYCRDVTKKDSGKENPPRKQLEAV